MYQILIFPKKAIETGWDLNAHPVGSNAYKFEKHEIDTEVVLVANEDYTSSPALTRLSTRSFDNNVCAIALQNKESMWRPVSTEDIGNIAVL